ncbi:flagellar biosynthesis anti-sigma factor FlgM [Alteribacillus sp. HJP-4]|uniref:flagellar biosynthesis anti-sigma factor FlgM n=1 Tax=Alteribacillus sp. HJP-4 TaxID=2775394 RepID=UPI0035CCFAA7
MKINPLGPLNNPYQKQADKQSVEKSGSAQQGRDKVEISEQAKQMQQGTSIDSARQEKIDALKEQVEAGTYEMNPQKTAQKFYDFWTGK